MSSLDFSDEEKKVLEATHLPWGAPIMTNHWTNESSNILLLHQPDHVTGNMSSYNYYRID